MQPTPLQAAIAALVTNVGNVAIVFGVLDNVRAASIEAAIVGAISVVGLVANELRHRTNTGK